MTLDELTMLLQLACKTQNILNQCFDERLEKIEKLVSEFESLFEDEPSEKKEEKPENDGRVYLTINNSQLDRLSKIEGFSKKGTYGYLGMPKNEIGKLDKIHFLDENYGK